MAAGLLAGGVVGVEVRADQTGLVHLGGVQLEPALAGVVAGAANEGGATHVGDVLHRLARGQAVGHFYQRTFSVAVEQQIALAIDHDGAAHFVAPVVVVGNAAQAAFNATQDDGHVFVGFAAALAIDNGGAVGALAADIAGGVGVVTADFAVRRVAVDHGVHVARCHTPKQIGFAQGLERLGAGPVRLGDDAHTKALCL